ncbi:MAG: hypothetical protein JSR77_07230 [Planctomycetes bacterium]|nr:hypothetical protein [Planctomycetota bacterium]
MQNADRALSRIIRSLAEERGICVQSIGEGWILQLTRGETVRHVYGYAFDLNTAATHQIACDKAATAEVLAARGVPHIPHRLFLHPCMARFVPLKGNWPGMLAFCEAAGWDVVAKENAGTGGRGVLRVRNPVQLESAVYSLFARSNSVALSPYREARTECRFILLNNRCELAFSKVRPSVIGDGTSTALELLAKQISMGGFTGDHRRLLENLEEDAAHALAQIPPATTEFLLNWRHNLGQGAMAKSIAPDSAPEASDLALSAAKALNLMFGSVDVLLTAQGPQVLEVNAGVMMEFVARGVEGGQEIAERIYAAALDQMFPPVSA